MVIQNCLSLYGSWDWLQPPCDPYIYIHTLHYIFYILIFFLPFLQIEDLKAQLKSCHKQLLDSNKHKQELEIQLRMALEREQDDRSGYISPVSCPFILLLWEVLL